MTRPRTTASPDARPDAPGGRTDGTAASRYASTLILSELARGGTDVGQSLDALRGQRSRALSTLRGTPEGARLAGAIAAAVETAAPLVQAARSAAVETRASAIAAASMLVAWLGEHDGVAASPSALAHLVSAARMGAAEARIHDDALARGLTGDALAEAMKLADRCATSRRYDFGAALAIYRASQATKPKGSAWPWGGTDDDAAPAPADEPIADVEPQDDAPDAFDDANEPSERAPSPVSYGDRTDERDDDEPEEAPRPRSGEANGGRHGMAPSFAIPGFDGATGRALPTRSAGPTREAKQAAGARGLEWDDETQRWTKGDA